MNSVKEPEILKAVNVEQPDNAYKRLARRLGVTIATQPSPMLLEHTLASLSIAVYDFSAVRRYLIEKRPIDHLFCWVPVSKKPATPRALIVRFHRYTGRGTMRHGHIADGTTYYDKPVPYPVLLTMDSIVKKGKELGFTPNFYISDYAMRERKPTPRRLDPFLAVGTSDSDALFVIERWDEPGFREETYSTKKKVSVKRTGKVGDAVKK